MISDGFCLAILRILLVRPQNLDELFLTCMSTSLLNFRKNNFFQKIDETGYPIPGFSNTRSWSKKWKFLFLMVVLQNLKGNLIMSFLDDMQSLVVLAHVVHSHEHAFVVTRDENFRRFFDEKWPQIFEKWKKWHRNFTNIIFYGVSKS